MFVFDMAKYEKPKFEEDELGINPFLSSLEIPVSKIKSDDRFTKDGELWYKANFEFDADNSCKVFSDSVRRLKMVKLSARGKDLLLWLVFEADKGKDYVWLNKDRYMEECKISSMNTYRSAVNDLIRNAYINRTVVTDIFWINPTLFYNGNRIKAFPDNVKEK